MLRSILTRFIYFTDDNLDMKRKQINSSIVSSFIYSIPLKLTTTDARIYIELHKTRVQSLLGKSHFPNGS